MTKIDLLFVDLPYIYIGVEVFRLSNSLQNFTCTCSNMSIISESAKRWSGSVEWSLGDSKLESSLD
jgi:hypothetical protein